MSRIKDYLAIIHGGGDEAVEIAQQFMGLSDFTVQDDEPRWIPVSERVPVIDPLAVTATVIVAHAEYNAHREPTGNVAVSPASYLGTDQQGPFFKSMINGRRLDSRAWMPLPEPPG